MPALRIAVTLLPLLPFGGFWWSVRNRGYREAFLLSAILWGVWVAITAELLSAFSAIYFLSVAISWGLATVIVGIFAVRRSRTDGNSVFSFRSLLKEIELAEISLLIAIVSILITLAAIAVIAPPNTWDAMEYNMPRIVMWIGNHSVRLYPTVDYQQLTMSAWSEYAMLNLMILRGSDRFAPLVQWFSFFGSIVAVSLLARELGATRRGQIVSAVLGATAPSGILFATSAKPDVTVAFWIVTSVYLLLHWRSDPSLGNGAAASGAVGLAIFSKGTAYLLLPGILFCIFWIWPGTIRLKALRFLPIFILVLAVICSPQFYRNFHISGSPLGFRSPDGDLDTNGERHFQNGRLGLGEMAANSLRNIALHLELPSNRANAWTESAFRKMIRGLGKDPDDPAMIEGGDDGGHEKFTVDRISLVEVRSGNLLHLGLFLLATCLLPFVPAGQRRDSTLVAVGIVISFLSVCGVLRYQTTNARFYLPLFFVACAVMGFVFTRVFPRWLVSMLCALALAGALPYVFSNGLRPLIPLHPGRGSSPSIVQASRAQLYFVDKHDYLMDSYQQSAQFVISSGCQDVGLDATLQHYEYPLLALTKAGLGGPSFRYVGIRNRSAAYDRSKHDPCAVVCLGCALVREKWGQYGGPNSIVRVFDRNLVFLRPKIKSDESSIFEASMSGVSPMDKAKPASAETLTPGCSLLRPADIRDIVGTNVSLIPTQDGCIYQSSTSILEIDDLNSAKGASSISPFILSEGTASIHFVDKQAVGTIVRDQNKPLLMYLMSPNGILSVNLDRLLPASEGDYLRVAERIDQSAAMLQ